jgi:hypothetical protein
MRGGKDPDVGRFILFDGIKRACLCGVAPKNKTALEVTT